MTLCPLGNTKLACDRIGSSTLAITAIAIMAFALLIPSVAMTAPLPVKPAGASALFASATPPQAPTPRNLTLYLHNDTLAKDVNGITTPYVFDTLQRFGRNDTITNVQQIVEDWYLFPTLAGDLVANGSITLDVFVSVVGTSPSLQSQTLTIDEVNATGVQTVVATGNFGAVPWYNQAHDLVLAIPGVHHTFAAGSSIRVLLNIQLGVRTGMVWYNGSWVPSHLVIQSDSFAQVGSLAFLDPQGTPRVTFDPMAADKTITIRVNVTDPFGGYDITLVNLTLVQPGGASVLTDTPMTWASGTPLSYTSTYELTFNYSSHPTGRYTATASVLDNTGLYYFEEFYTTTPFLAQFSAFFYVGGLPVYVNVKAVDSKGIALPGATITLLSGNVAEATVAADATGAANLTMPIGSYSLQGTWQGVPVANQSLDATTNVSAANPILIACAVYYPVFHAEDAQGAALADATLLFIHPNGQEIGPYRTDAYGNVSLSQVPVGTYAITASWRGINVYSGTAAVSGNAMIPFETAVYELTVTAKADNGQVLPGAYVSVIDSTGQVFDSNITGPSGTVVLRLPAGNYTIEARYITSDMGSLYDSGNEFTPIDLRSSTTATVTFGSYPLPLTSTFDFLIGLVFAIVVAALLVVLFLVWRRSKGSKPTPPAAEPEKKE